jgi:DNA repair exonuclease SbcCD ATPase subunit
MSYTSQAQAYANRQRAQETTRRLEATIKSTENWIQRKMTELESAPAYRRDCIINNIRRSEKSLESLKSGLASVRRNYC